MTKNKLTPEIIEKINKEYENIKSIRKVRDKLNDTLNIDLTYHNVRDSIGGGIDIEGKEIPNEIVDNDVKEFVEFMTTRNISIKDLKSHFYNKEITDSGDLIISDGKDEFEFGVVSDTHLGAKTCALSELHHFYKMCKDRGIKDVLHAGDLCDGGGKIYPGQLSELQVYGYDDMLDFIKNNYPKQEGIKTHFILGNHDEDFLKHGGANIGKAISQVREDMNYLGFYDANIVINGVKIGLHHGAGGASYAQCFDDKTEILTNNGRKYFKDIDTYDKVATLNRETKDFEWQMPTGYVNEEYEGDMYHFKSKNVDCMVTPNHRMWIKRYEGQKKHLDNILYPSKSHRRISWDWDFMYAEDVYNSKGNIRQKYQMTKINNLYNGTNDIDENTIITIPLIEPEKYGHSIHNISSISLDNLTKFIGWYISEGGCSQENGKHYNIKIHQYKTVNPDKYKEIEDLVNTITNGRYGKTDKYIEINSKNFYYFITQICGKGFKNKFIDKFYKELPHKFLMNIFENAIKGDGWISDKGFGYCTASKKLESDMCELGQKLGFAVTSNFRPKEGTEGVWNLRFSNIHVNPTINNKPKQIYYKGKIYCVEVPNSIILVRRNGKTLWTGNSYKIQKYVETLTGDRKPQIYILGHYHGSLFMSMRNIHCLLPACFQKPNNFSVRLGLPNIIGGYIIKIKKTNNNEVREITPTFYPYYVK